jgi:pyruvate formate lyase activating enzyme
MQGLVFDIRHCTIHDGQGIRTTVFLKGCPLRCWWCHNPEGMSTETQEITHLRQIGSKKFYEKKQIGQYISSNELLEIIKKDLVFYEESGGGVTFSGGEPLMQGEFLIDMLDKCKNQDIHTILDTSGYGNKEILKKALAYIDLVLFDIKLLDDELHKKYVGVSNKTILENFDMIIEENKNVIVRYPLIPGINDSQIQLAGLDAFLQKKVKDLHFLPYHSIATYKYEQIGLENMMVDTKEPNEIFLETLKKDFTNKGFNVKIGG